MIELRTEGIEMAPLGRMTIPSNAKSFLPTRSDVNDALLPLSIAEPHMVGEPCVTLRKSAPERIFMRSACAVPPHKKAGPDYAGPVRRGTLT
jgi:hypothetical protein